MEQNNTTQTDNILPTEDNFRDFYILEDGDRRRIRSQVIKFLIYKKTNLITYVMTKLNFANCNFKNSLQKELSAITSLNNKHILKYYLTEITKDNKELYIIMEYCKEGTLFEYIENKRNNKEKIEEKNIRRWIYQILKGLDYLQNEKNILHKSLESHSVLLDSYLDIKIGGLNTNILVNEKYKKAFLNKEYNNDNLYYLDLEALENGNFNEKTTIFATGVFAYELCTFQKPFEGKTKDDIIYKKKHNYSSLREKIPENYTNDLKDLIISMLEPHNSKRKNLKNVIDEALNLYEERNFQTKDQKIGLPYLEHSYYLNTVIQTLYYLPEFSRFILNEQFNKTKHKLTYALQKVFECKRKHNDVRNELNDFIKVLFNGNETSEIVKKAKPCIIYIMCKLNDELNLYSGHLYKEKNVDKSNLEEEFMYQLEKFTNEQNSIVSEYFFGYDQKTFRCQSCKKEYYEIKPDNYVEIFLEKIWRFFKNIKIEELKNKVNSIRLGSMPYDIKQKMFNDLNNLINNLADRLITLGNYFDFYQTPREENLLRNQKCNFCNKTVNVDVIKSFYTLPKIMFIFLTYRAKDGSIFECKVDFTEDLDVSEYVKDISPKKYKLQSVIYKESETSHVVCCKTFDDKWKRFQNEYVIDTSFNEMKKEKGRPYVLVYKSLGS